VQLDARCPRLGATKVDGKLAAGFIEKMGVDMGALGTVFQLTSWASICPAITNLAASADKRSARPCVPLRKLHSPGTIRPLWTA
jgi:hypothetical protein